METREHPCSSEKTESRRFAVEYSGNLRSGDIEWYTETIEKLPIPIRAASNNAKDPDKAAQLRASTFHTNAERFLNELGEVFADYHREFASKIAAF